MTRARFVGVCATVCMSMVLTLSACDGEGSALVTCEPACAGGEVCSVDGVCVAVAVTCEPACEAGAVCSADGECVATTVTCEPACAADAVCSADGMCVTIGLPPTCEPACQADEVCTDEGACVAGPVTCEPPCEDGQVCSIEGLCVATAVTCEPACAGGEVCSADGACVAALTPCDPACEVGQVCIHGVCLTETAHTGMTLLDGPFAAGPEVTSACLSCHEEQGDHVMASAHFQWKGPTPGLEGHETGGEVGKRNTINNFCIAVVSNEARCAQCHAGYGYADPGYGFDAVTQVDCLVCHDGSGQYKKDKKTAGHVEEGVDLALAAMSVGPPSRANCGACHFYAGGGDNVKKGDLGSWATDPSDEADVHMGGEGMTCVDCHTAEDHKIAGGGLHNPVQEAPLSCTDCHLGPVIHEDTPALDTHAQHVACETCHIKTFSRQQPTKLEWWWETAGDMDREPVLDAHGKPDYDKMKGDFVWGQGVEPVLAWSNGTFSRMLVGDVYTVEPVDLGSPMGTIDDPAAKIAPFKVMRGNQPADTVNSLLAVPHLFGTASGPSPYWGAWDWDLAISEGMAAAGLDYSGTYGFVETSLHLELHHEVAGGEHARDCMDCHNGGIDFVALGYSGDPMVVGAEHATE